MGRGWEGTKVQQLCGLSEAQKPSLKETEQSWQTVPSRVGLLMELHPTSHLDRASGRDGPTARVAVGFGVKPQSCWAVTPRIQSPEPNPQAGLPNRSAHWLPAGPLSSE